MLEDSLGRGLTAADRCNVNTASCAEEAGARGKGKKRGGGSLSLSLSRVFGAVVVVVIS